MTVKALERCHFLLLVVGEEKRSCRVTVHVCVSPATSRERRGLVTSTSSRNVSTAASVRRKSSWSCLRGPTSSS